MREGTGSPGTRRRGAAVTRPGEPLVSGSGSVRGGIPVLCPLPSTGRLARPVRSCPFIGMRLRDPPLLGEAASLAGSLSRGLVDEVRYRGWPAAVHDSMQASDDRWLHRSPITGSVNPASPWGSMQRL